MVNENSAATVNSRRRRYVFRAAFIFGTLIFLDVICHLVLWVGHGGLSTVSENRSKAAGLHPDRMHEYFQHDFVIHPFIGAVLQPPRTEEERIARGGTVINDFGFPGEDSPVQKRSADTVIVGILGGSVAREFAESGLEELNTQLSRIPKFRGKSFRFIRLGMDGYKQPQQLMIVTWLLTLGAQFDVVINLDGVNEAALPIMDNIPKGVFAAYPRNWQQLINSASSMEVKRRIGLVTYLRTQVRDRAVFFSRPPLCWSGTANLIWQGLHNARTKEILAELTVLTKLDCSDLTYCASGPRQDFSSRVEMCENAVQIWSRSSQLLHSCCESHEITYFHFLQPNQYVADSKQMSDAEQKWALSEESPFRQPVIDCYPLMQKAGGTLKKNGLRFYDLTQVFAGTVETVYRDDCCHLHSNGSEIMAREMGRIIAASYASDSDTDESH